MCKSAPLSRQITTPAPLFTGRIPFLPPNQQCKSNEGKGLDKRWEAKRGGTENNRREGVAEGWKTNKKGGGQTDGHRAMADA